jgi:hypothetical protein
MIKLPKCHVSTICTCFTSLWPKEQKTPYTPFIHIKERKKSHAQCYPMFNQKLHNQKLRSKDYSFWRQRKRQNTNHLENEKFLNSMPHETVLPFPLPLGSKLLNVDFALSINTPLYNNRQRSKKKMLF